VEGALRAPLKRIATVEEVAATALFLATGATAMTGETIKVDCGVVALRLG
jgi:enoyl-[acyl-carrier-protein] reductase (NADH)